MLKLIITALLLVSVTAGSYAQDTGIYRLPPFERAVICIKYFEGLHTAKDYPYVGYGHRIQANEHFRLPLTHAQADTLLRSDLHRLCTMFRQYGKDSLLLATLAYNVGYGAVCGNNRRGKSRLLQKIENGDRNIYDDYIDFCRYQGKMLSSIRKRRQMELFLIGY